MNMSPNEDKNPPAGAPLRSLKILVVDDIFINHVILETILRDQGHMVESAKTGVAAVEAVKKNDFDLILMDINMPVMDGKAATRQIRDLPGPKSDIPIIACTADMEDSHLKDYHDAGMNSAICKPISRRDLLNALDHYHDGTLDFTRSITGSSHPDSIPDKKNSIVLANLLKKIGG